jgi:hypothetical protein
MSWRLFEAAENESATFIYPRLPRATARNLVDERAGWPLDKLRQESQTSHPLAAPARAGTVVTEEMLARVRENVRSALERADPRFGCPLLTGRVAEFDRTVGFELYTHMQILPADAASEGVWSFMTLILLPEIGPWRFPEAGAKRYFGVHRNVLRRTWWRAHLLGPDLGGRRNASPHLGEDELVQIFERPTLAANPRLTRAIVSTIHEASPQLTIARTTFVRDFTRRVVRLTPFLCLDAFSYANLQKLLTDIAAESVQALKRDD